ncbi:hypothetical protein U27_03383 [Candidatus Vecturithrix granuli]|uniref:Uncharacterized protein n=1 Tax=Vecturithrix granuli TaxID=1499967 RepID=A0A081BVR6_VECG1|nr:hypothetical protein U27_03383 [Candidatus Vecturithrix granuli]
MSVGSPGAMKLREWHISKNRSRENSCLYAIPVVSKKIPADYI